jgi:WD40 repeat protein
VTPDNKYAIFCSGNKTVRIWNLNTKIQEAVLEAHGFSVVNMEITSDYNYIVSISKDKFIII